MNTHRTSLSGTILEEGCRKPVAWSPRPLIPQPPPEALHTRSCCPQNRHYNPSSAHGHFRGKRVRLAARHNFLSCVKPPSAAAIHRDPMGAAFPWQPTAARVYLRQGVGGGRTWVAKRAGSPGQPPSDKSHPRGYPAGIRPQSRLIMGLSGLGPGDRAKS